MIVLGLLMGLVGTDVNSGVARFSFDIPELTDGIGFVTIAMGVFGYGEIIANLSRPRKKTAKCSPPRCKVCSPQRRISSACSRRAARPLLALPWVSCLAVVRCCRLCGLHHREEDQAAPWRSALRPRQHPRCGGPESANNAGSQTSFIPLLTLGIPPNAVMALMVGAMTIHNIQPGPR